MTDASCTNIKPCQRSTARQHSELADCYGRNTSPTYDFEDVAQELDNERQVLHQDVLAGATAYIWIYYATGWKVWTAGHTDTKLHKAGWKLAKIWKNEQTQKIEWTALACTSQYTELGKWKSYITPNDDTTDPLNDLIYETKCGFDLSEWTTVEDSMDAFDKQFTWARADSLPLTSDTTAAALTTSSPINMDMDPVEAAKDAVGTAMKASTRSTIHLNLSTALVNTHITNADVRTLVDKVQAGERARQQWKPLPTGRRITEAAHVIQAQAQETDHHPTEATHCNCLLATPHAARQSTCTHIENEVGLKAEYHTPKDFHDKCGICNREPKETPGEEYVCGGCAKIFHTKADRDKHISGNRSSGGHNVPLDERSILGGAYTGLPWKAKCSKPGPSNCPREARQKTTAAKPKPKPSPKPYSPWPD